MRRDTFTLDGGHLAKIRMIYAIPIADIEGFHTKSFDELLAGLREAYGEPSKSYSEPVVNTYGVRRNAHRAIWLGKQNVISIIEQPGEHSWKSSPKPFQNTIARCKRQRPQILCNNEVKASHSRPD